VIPVFVDSHAHLNHERFFQEVPDALARAREAGVSRIVNVGFDVASSWLAVELAERHEGCYAVVGLHPHDARDFTPAVLDELLAMTASDKVVGVGEAGLDFHYDNSPRPQQKLVFAECVRFAARVDLPLVVHAREADLATLEVLDEAAAPGQRMVMHCFGSDLNFARECVDRGYLLGIAGPVTFPNAVGLRRVVEKLGLAPLMLETDCPYLAPQARRGKRNEPSYIPLIAAEVARILGCSVEEVAAATTANTQAFYAIP
jgi:TatD DNase family protein